MSPHDFYNAVYSTAIGLGANDVQARLAASQASEETGFGQHMVGNNAFGIKAGSNYTGPSVSASTEEEYNGNTVREQANFRAYDDFTGSVKDYLSTIQSNFPDAWSASTFEDAVQGLNTGVYGKYATRAAYGKHITAIDGKYGGLQYAQNPANVPAPYGPNDYVDLTGLPNDVVPVADQNFVNSDPAFAFAQNPSNVPTPGARPNIPTAGLLSAFQPNEEYNSPFDAVMTAPKEVASNEWGVINGVGPVYTPTVNQWEDVASAPPVQAPMDSVTASGLLGATPALTANAAANPMMSLAAEGLLGTTPGLSANATVSGLPEVASVSSRMGIAEPGFDQSRFDGSTVSVANDFDPGRFASPAAFDQSRFGPSIDVATNTQSFMDQPTTSAAPANLGSFPEGYAAQRGPTTGLLSADFQSLQGNTERQLQNPSLLAPTPTPQLDVAATGLLSGNMPLAAQATVPSLMTNETVQEVATPTTTTGLGLLSPESLVAASPSLTTSMPSGIIGAQPVQQNAFVDSFPDAVVNNTIEPATINGVVAPPTLDTIQVADQPSIATVDGPATTPAVDQQAEQTAATEQATTSTAPARSLTSPQIAAKSTIGQKITNAINPGTIGGGLLGGLAAGPIGGVLGGLLGNSVYSNGGLTGLLGPGFSAPTTNIGGGIANIAGIYGGAFAPGNFAVANNGATITAQPGGWSTYTNKYGVTEAIGPDGKIAGYFGSGIPDPEAESSTSSGGFFGGLFG